MAHFMGTANLTKRQFLLIFAIELLPSPKMKIHKEMKAVIGQKIIRLKTGYDFELFQK
jgi:hypothetical protein